MIGLDTNVLVRCVMQDDPRQSQKASRLIESLTSEAPGFVPLVALIELVWVLTSCYDLTREQIRIPEIGLRQPAYFLWCALLSETLLLRRSAQPRRSRSGCRVVPA